MNKPYGKVDWTGSDPGAGAARERAWLSCGERESLRGNPECLQSRKSYDEVGDTAGTSPRASYLERTSVGDAWDVTPFIS